MPRGGSQALPSGSSGPRIAILKEERMVRLRAEEVHVMEEVTVTDWEAEAKALRQQIVELEGERKSSVLNRVVASHPEQLGGAGTRRQTTSLRRRSSLVSPTPLGVVVCEAF